MAKGLLLAWSSPVSDERDAEFNSWYDDTHIPQVRTAIASITAAGSSADRPPAINWRAIAGS